MYISKASKAIVWSKGLKALIMQFSNLNLIVRVNLFYFVCVHIIYFEGLMED